MPVTYYGAAVLTTPGLYQRPTFTEEEYEAYRRGDPVPLWSAFDYPTYTLYTRMIWGMETGRGNVAAESAWQLVHRLFRLGPERGLEQQCAWCGTLIVPGLQPVSHGICGMCLLKEPPTF